MQTGIVQMFTLPYPNPFLQQYEAKLTEGEDYGYDKELENILIRHVQDVVGLSWKCAVCGQDCSSYSLLSINMSRLFREFEVLREKTGENLAQLMILTLQCIPTFEYHVFALKMQLK